MRDIIYTYIWNLYIRTYTLQALDMFSEVEFDVLHLAVLHSYEFAGWMTVASNSPNVSGLVPRNVAKMALRNSARWNVR